MQSATHLTNLPLQLLLELPSLIYLVALVLSAVDKLAT